MNILDNDKYNLIYDGTIRVVWQSEQVENSWASNAQKVQRWNKTVWTMRDFNFGHFTILLWMLC